MLLPLSVTVYIVATTVCVTLVNLLLLSLLLLLVLLSLLPVSYTVTVSVVFVILFMVLVTGGGRGGVFPYSLGGGVPLGSRKSYLLLDQMLQILWPDTRLEMLNYSWFQSFVSDPVKRDPNWPYTRPNGLKTIPPTRPNGFKTIPSPTAHTRIANIWEYPIATAAVTVAACYCYCYWN